MKAKEISLNLTRNIGAMEFAKMSVTYEINEGDDVVDSFKSAQLEINEAFDELFPDYHGLQVEDEIKHDNINKQLLSYDDDRFAKIKKRIDNGTLTIEDVEKYYVFGSKERFLLLQK